MFKKQIAMSIQKPSIKPQILSSSISSNISKGQLKKQITATPPQYEKYYISIQTADQTGIFWTKTFVPKTNERGMVLKFNEQRFTLVNRQSAQFPDIIWVCAIGQNGYLNQEGAGTTRLAGFSLSNVTTTVDVNNVLLYNATYQLPGIQTWDLPVGATLSLQVFINNQTTALGSLQNPLPLLFTIVHLTT